MSRLFLSLRVQDQSYYNIDPYTVTSWRPSRSESVLEDGHIIDIVAAEKPKRRVKANDPHNHEILQHQDDDFSLVMEPMGDEQVMVLYPAAVHRKEIIQAKTKQTPEESRNNYVYMELSIEKKEQQHCVALKTPKVSFIHAPKGTLLRVDSPTFTGRVQPRPATPSSSQQNVTYLQSKELLRLKKPRSGFFINEQVVGDCELQQPENKRAATLDPRRIQSQVDAVSKRDKFIVRTSPSYKHMIACIDPCRPCVAAKTRATQTLFDRRSILCGKTDLRRLRPEADSGMALAVAAVGFLYSRLDDAQLWTSNTLDGILELGIGLHDCWMKPTASEQPSSNLETVRFSIGQMPHSVDIEDLRLDVGITPSIRSGTTASECSQLNGDIVGYFASTAKPAGILIHVGGELALALWRKDNLFYLFNAHGCDDIGRIVVPSDEQKTTAEASTSESSACVLMNNRLAVLTDVIDENVKALCKTPTELFVMHEIRVQNVDRVERNPYSKVDQVKCPQPKTASVDPDVSRARIKNPLHLNCKANLLKSQEILKVPADDLSNLSLASTRKRKGKPITDGNDEKPAPNVDIQATAPAVSVVNKITNEIAPTKLMGTTLIAVCEETLENVMRKIEDRIETKCIIPDVTDGKRARKVLVKSDLGCLKRAKIRLHRGLDVEECRDDEIKPLTLAEELALPTNLQAMPDGSHLLHGTQHLFGVIEYNTSICVVAPILAVVLSHKYSISTWDAAIVDFCLSTTKYVQQCIPFGQYQMFRARHNHLPDIQVGGKRYTLSVNALSWGPERNIGDMLSSALATCDRVVLASTVYNAAIFRRHHFWYLFDGYACDPVGIRSSDMLSGAATLQRFARFEDLVRRIHCNQSVARDDQQFAVMRAMVADVSESTGLVEAFRFEPRPAAQEQDIIERLAQEQQELVRRNNEKLRELNELIRREKCRIKNYYKKAGKVVVMPYGEKEPNLLRPEMDNFVKFDEHEEQNENESNADGDTVEKKKTTAELSPFEQILRLPYGYNCIQPDLFHKIQGSTCLPNRFRFRGDGIRACHFCSMYAMLLAFNRRWADWNFRLVDLCIEEGLSIYRTMTTTGENVFDKQNVARRWIRAVPVDRDYYEIEIDRYVDQSPMMLYASVGVLEQTLERFFQKRRFVLLQFPNCTFGIIRRQCYNLFDPYASHELRDSERPFRWHGGREWSRMSAEERQPEEDTIAETDKPTKKRAGYPEKNTASWICMPTLGALLGYVRQRIRARDMNHSFELYCIHVMGISKSASAATKAGKRVPRDHLYAHHLCAYSLRPDERPPRSFESLARSVPDEEVRMLEAKPTLVPWSRLLPDNLMGHKRYTKQSRWKAYDCELEGELYSLWSHVHPMAALFRVENRGRQALGICVLAGCMAVLYPVEEWTRMLMDYIVVQGDRYFGMQVAPIVDAEYEVSLENMVGTVRLDSFELKVDVAPLVSGHLYAKQANEFNLKRALLYLFKEPKRRFGVLQCHKRCLALGQSARGQYFMFDCMSAGEPLFSAFEGGAYVLMCSTLRRLLSCVVLTLRVPCYNVGFMLYGVDCVVVPDDCECAVAADDEKKLDGK